MIVSLSQISATHSIHWKCWVLIFHVARIKQIDHAFLKAYIKLICLYILTVTFLSDRKSVGRNDSLKFKYFIASYTRQSVHRGCCNSFVYTSGHCRRWRSRMEVKIMAGSLFVHCKIAYFYSVTADKWLIVSLPNFVTIRRTHFSVSCKIFSWILSTKLRIHAVEFCDFIKDSVSPSGLFVPCSLTVTSTWRPRLTAHCPIGERH